MVKQNGLYSVYAFLDGYGIGVSVLTAFGLIAAICVIIFALIWGIKYLWRGIVSMRSAARLKAFKNEKSVGLGIVLARPVGRQGRAFGRNLHEALTEHLPGFNFGAPFRMIKLRGIAGGGTPKAMMLARRWLKRSDADMIVWGERVSGAEDGLVLYTLSRGGGLSPEGATLEAFPLPGGQQAWSDALRKAAAYMLAKSLQPGLRSPEAFRPEKTKLLAEELIAILEADPEMSPTVRAEIEADYCAAVIHGAEKAGDMDRLDHVIALRRGHLADKDIQSNTFRLMQSRVDLGRALIARSDKVYHAADLQEAIEHLSAVVEVIRTHPTIQRAQATSDAMFKAQTMIENRKRFSQNF